METNAFLDFCRLLRYFQAETYDKELSAMEHIDKLKHTCMA